MTRLFISIPISDEAKNIISERIFNNSRYKHPSIKWVSEINLHITLKFFGEIQENRIPDIKQIIERVSSLTDPFNLALYDSGTFPNVKSPRVIWLGIHTGNKIIYIHNELEKLCIEAGFPSEKKAFSPHLTLARISEYRSSIPQEGLQILLNEINKLEIPAFTAHQINLMESILNKNGAIYKLRFSKEVKSLLT